ncbi:MAG: hypothetical protein J5945_04360, partial [Candidatus Methanomethylophilus sp.]|nr:hypothetical protein [Methanomethylophilus sp.]
MQSENIVTLQYMGKEYIFETVNLLDTGNSTTILKLTYNANRNVINVYLYQSGIHFESGDDMGVYINDYRVWTDSQCYVDVSKVSSNDFNGTFYGSIGGMDSFGAFFPIISSEESAEFSWNGGSMVSNLDNGAITVRPSDTSVNKSITFQTDSVNSGFLITCTGNTTPVELYHPSSQGTVAVTATYVDGTSGSYDIDYSTVQGKILRMEFNPADLSTVKYVSNNEIKGVTISTGGNPLTIGYGSYTYSAVEGDTSAISVETSSGDNFLRLTGGSLNLSASSSIIMGNTNVGSSENDVRAQFVSRTYSVYAEEGAQFTIEGYRYTAIGGSSYQLFMPDLLPNYGVHGVLLASGQSVGLGNNALAYLTFGSEQVGDYVGVRNDSLFGTEERVLTVNNTDSSLSSDSEALYLGTYAYDNNQSQLTSYKNYILSGSVNGTVSQSGVLTQTGGTGTVSSTTVVESGDTLTVTGGTTFSATERSVFSGSEGSYVLESGGGSLSHTATTSISVMCPDGNVRTITGASTVSMGATITFTASARSSIVFPDIATYAVGENATLILDANNMITMTEGRVTVPEGDSIIISGATFTAVGSDGDVQYIHLSLNVYIFAGKFSLASSQPISIDYITFEAAETGIMLGTSSYSYVDSAVTVGISSDSVQLISVEPRITFTGTISIKNHEYTSKSAQAVMYRDQNDVYLSSGTVSPDAEASVKLVESGIVITGRPLTVTDGGTVTVEVGEYVNVSLDTQEFVYSHPQSIDSLVILSFAVSQGNLIANLLSGTIWLRGDGGGANSVLVNNLQYSTESGAFITYGTYPELVSGTAVIEAGAALKIGTSQFTATDIDATLTADNGVATLDSGKVT